MKGRKPKPTALHILNGNPGRQDLSLRNEPEFRREIPSCPEHLDSEALKEWTRLAPELDAIGMLTTVDRAALAAYCQSYSRWVKAENMIQKTGEVLKDSETGNLYPNPYLRICFRALEHMHKFLIEFGFTPSSRARVNARKTEKSSAKERFFRSG